MKTPRFALCAAIVLLTLNGCRTSQQSPEAAPFEPTTALPGDPLSPIVAPPTPEATADTPVTPPEPAPSAMPETAAAAKPQPEYFQWVLDVPENLRSHDQSLLQVELRSERKFSSPLRLRWQLRQNGRDCDFGGIEPQWRPEQHAFIAEIPFHARNSGDFELSFTVSDVDQQELGSYTRTIATAPFGAAESLEFIGALPPGEEKFLGFELPDDVALETLTATVTIAGAADATATCTLSSDGLRQTELSFAGARIEKIVPLAVNAPGQHNLALKSLSGDDALDYAIRLTYHLEPRRRDAVASRPDWRLNRTYYLLEPTQDPDERMVEIDGGFFRRVPLANVGSIPVGSLLESALILQAARPGLEVQLADSLPAGFELLATDDGTHPIAKLVTDAHGLAAVSHRLRAKFPGKYHIPPAIACDGEEFAKSETGVIRCEPLNQASSKSATNGK